EDHAAPCLRLGHRRGVGVRPSQVRRRLVRRAFVLRVLGRGGGGEQEDRRGESKSQRAGSKSSHPGILRKRPRSCVVARGRGRVGSGYFGGAAGAAALSASSRAVTAGSVPDVNFWPTSARSAFRFLAFVASSSEPPLISSTFAWIFPFAASSFVFS